MKPADSDAWRVRFVAPRTVARHARDCGMPAGERAVGLCDYGTRTIYIADNMNARDTRETLIHELIHAIIPRASHRRVYALAAAIETALRER